MPGYSYLYGWFTLNSAKRLQQSSSRMNFIHLDLKIKQNLIYMTLSFVSSNPSWLLLVIPDYLLFNTKRLRNFSFLTKMCTVAKIASIISPVSTEFNSIFSFELWPRKHARTIMKHPWPCWVGFFSRVVKSFHANVLGLDYKMLSKLCKGLKRADSQYLKNRALEIMCIYKMWSDLKGE